MVNIEVSNELSWAGLGELYPNSAHLNLCELKAI